MYRLAMVLATALAMSAAAVGSANAGSYARSQCGSSGMSSNRAGGVHMIAGLNLMNTASTLAASMRQSKIRKNDILLSQPDPGQEYVKRGIPEVLQHKNR